MNNHNFGDIIELAFIWSISVKVYNNLLTNLLKNYDSTAIATR